MPKRKQPFEVIRVSNYSIPIYKTSKGYTAKWELGGTSGRIDRVQAADIRDEIKQLLVKISQGEPADVEVHLRKQLAYYRTLEERAGETPLHIIVDAYIASNPQTRIIRAKVSDLVSQFEISKKAVGISSHWHARLYLLIGIFSKAFPERYIDTITAQEIAEWLIRISVGDRTRRNYHNAVKQFFRWAKLEAKALHQKSLTEPEMLANIRAKRPKVLTYTPEEMTAVLKACEGPTPTRDIIVLVGFCGLRASEAHGEETDHDPLPIENILFDFDHIRVGEQKVQTKGDRFAILPENAKAWLAHLKGKKGPIWTQKNFQDSVKKVFKKAGVKYRRNAFRKSWITYRMAIVRNAHQVADEAGNSASEITKSYRRPELAHVAVDWFGIFPTL